MLNGVMEVPRFIQAVVDCSAASTQFCRIQSTMCRAVRAIFSLRKLFCSVDGVAYLIVSCKRENSKSGSWAAPKSGTEHDLQEKYLD